MTGSSAMDGFTRKLSEASTGLGNNASSIDVGKNVVVDDDDVKRPVEKSLKVIIRELEFLLSYLFTAP